ncbi:3-(3-hydroxy-phenyl)propionate transporter MhpT [Escherichia coli]|nr:3-(3-hydroxy-phenyl)propionate transporter MhpT [Escherichia coli]
MSAITESKPTRRWAMPDTLVIIFFVAILTSLATWVVPVGMFDSQEVQYQVDGQTKTRKVVDPHSFRILTNEAGEPEYHRVQLFTTGDERPGLMNFPFEGLTSGSKYGTAVGIIMFMLVIGGAFGIVMRTGTIDNGILALIRHTRGNEILFIPALFILFSLGGALVGGMLADRYGRKRILISSVALFGLFSLATAIAWDFPSLVFARLMTGVGLGAALPNLIALTSEAAGPRFRGTAVSLMYCGVPIGAALAATLGFAGANLAWQTVFWVGGVVPLILVPLLMRWLPESAVFAGEKQAAPPLRALFAPETATATLLLWLCYFFTLLVVYMLINWLPLLLVEQGFQPSQAAGVMFALQMGAASGTLMLGALMDKLRPVTMSLLIYSGMLASLLALGTVSSFNGMLLAGFVAGLFATGGQSVLYALAPLFYSSQIRATGVGTAVAVGRLGAMSGPLLAGKMLALGTGTVGVMAASAPGILVAGLAVFILMSRRSRIQPCADA